MQPPQPPEALPVGVVPDPCAQGPDNWQGNPEAWRIYDWSQRCRYWQENAHLPPASTERVVFIGDSLTEAWREADPELFTKDTLNRGISGQTSDQMLLRFRSDVIDLGPGVVHIMAGINDVAGNAGPTSVAIFQSNIRSMVEAALLHHIRVVLASILPADLIPWRSEIANPAQTIAVMNHWLRSYAQCEHLVFVDYAAALDDGQGGMNPGLSTDGLHPAGPGYAVMTPLARAAIAQARSQPVPSGPTGVSCFRPKANR